MVGGIPAVHEVSGWVGEWQAAAAGTQLYKPVLQVLHQPSAAQRV